MKWLVAIGSFLAVLISALFMARQSGKDTIKKDIVEKSLDNLKKANVIDATVDSLSDAELDKRLRKYVRK